MPDRYAVVGNPVSHSLSPRIHAAFARQTGADVDYIKLPAPLTEFAAVVTKFFEAGGRGVNVTLPFKKEAWQLAHENRGDATMAQAANVIDCRDGRLIGYNTDGLGLLADLERNLAFTVKGRQILLLGAGGAAHGVAPALLRAQPKSMVIANRTMDKAHSLIRRMSDAGQATTAGLKALEYRELAGSRFELVINTTSAGLSGEMPPLPAGIFAPSALAYDMVYARQTPFMQFAGTEHARVSDGLGMLAEQAAESFLIWRGVRPDTASVLSMLRKSLD